MTGAKDDKPLPSSLTRNCTHTHIQWDRIGKKTARRGQWREGWREGKAVTSQTQTGGLMMNIKKRKEKHTKEAEAEKKNSTGEQNKKTRQNKERKTEGLFCPKRIDEVILQVSPPRGTDPYTHTHTLISKEHQSL